jgi:carotenoid cleavage dioxygenase-like enzyme
MDMKRMKFSLMVFKMEGDNTFKRKMIANIPQDRTSMQHAFAMTHEYAIIFDPPYYIDFDTYGMMFQNKQLLDLIENDLQGTTKIHVVRLSDGEVTTIDSKKWSLVLHFSNAYQLDEDTLVVEGPAYENPDFNPFGMFATKNLICPDNLAQKEQGSLYKKFIINLKDKTVTHEPMVVSKWGGLDFPSYNPKWDGVAKHRYTYLFQLMHQADYDENYHWPIHKYDDEKKMIVATFGPPLTVGQEPRFVANPNTTDEEDGLIISTFYHI